MHDGFSVAVVIPALDEEASLPGVLAAIPGWVDRVFVVDNGSTDATATVAAARGATVIHEPRRGYGRACLAGIAAADMADILVFMDADGSDQPDQMERLVGPIVQGRADLVIGSRTRGKCQRGAMTMAQRLGNALATTLMRIFWRVAFTDLGPFRAIRTASLLRLKMDDEAFGWTVQMQIRAARFGLRCTEAPVDYAPRSGGRSKVSGTLRGVLFAAVTILKCIAEERWAPRHHCSHDGESLAILAKQPVPGQSKSRLIPALGAQGAADLHRAMVRRTRQLAAEFSRHRAVFCTVWHTVTEGCTIDDCFDGADLRPQIEGDLGERMLHIFIELLRRASAAVIIGTDCPDLSVDDLEAAFDALRNHDLVLGPANDGGYYLIGLVRPVPALFAQMTWSHEGVLEETLRRANHLGLRVHLLPPHNDVDEPKDLEVWARATGRRSEDSSEVTPLLSVVIPTLNEAHIIAKTVDSVSREGVEIIVSDGGSTDGTQAIAAAHGARVVRSAPGRGPQLNAGVALARADRLMFLHADTRPPHDFLEIIGQTLSDKSVALGAFRFRLDRDDWRYRMIEWAVGLRCALFASPYGDQALFMRRATFRAVGGFDTIALMEDFVLVRRARRLGRVRIARSCAVTSSRRWIRNGVVRTTVVNQLCILGFLAGLSPRRLAAWRHGLADPPRRKRAAASQMEQLGASSPKAFSVEAIAPFEVETRKQTNPSFLHTKTSLG